MRLRRKSSRPESYEAQYWHLLANYNSERGRGLVHTPEWQERMAELQREFNTAHAIRGQHRESE